MTCTNTIAGVAGFKSAIVGLASSPHRAALAMTSTVTYVRRVARVGRGLTAHRLPSCDSPPLSPIQGVSDARDSHTMAVGLTIRAVNDLSQSARKVMGLLRPW